MRASDFDYQLPDERIAQAPADQRDGARLFVLPRAGGEATHARVSDLPGLLPVGALLVVNDTRVFPARLRGKKATGGRVELLLLRLLRRGDGDGGAWDEAWTCLGGSSKGLKPGQGIALDGETPPTATVEAVNGAEVEVSFRARPGGDRGMLEVAERLGEVPLPPYILRPEAPGAGDRERYQTVFARVPGAAAAPTAGLHFTPRLLAALAARGIGHAAITLHVGLGTFAPLRSDDLDGVTELHAERYAIPGATVNAIAAARAAGRKVIAVGTTTVRALESASREEDGQPREGEGESRLFIRPGHRFRVVDGLITNFHLPRSTLLMLVAAFAGRERVLEAYREAVARDYRFYSYGDAMLIA
ncbi:MAG: tRNA preQ1(34) S-adenosylmethionine ribosyltransferase-isomerase QueA [Myxococcales bacterium]|nr:tRNA preQ1(34) S-adenosylmethionine ribosyltransferase-isomerase QueA [Myxococcales bacterium]